MTTTNSLRNLKQSKDAIRQVSYDNGWTQWWHHTDNNTVLRKTWRQNHGTEIEEPIRDQFERISSTNYAAGYTCSVFSEARSGYATPPRISYPLSAINLLFHSIQRACQSLSLSHTIDLEGNLGWTTQAVAYGFMPKLNEPCRQLRRLHHGQLTAAGPQTSQVAMGRENRLMEKDWGSERWEMFPKN